MFPVTGSEWKEKPLRMSFFGRIRSPLERESQSPLSENMHGLPASVLPEMMARRVRGTCHSKELGWAGPWLLLTSPDAGLTCLAFLTLQAPHLRSSMTPDSVLT